jgi:uncharacterized protein (DUF58 family)
MTLLLGFSAVNTGNNLLYLIVSSLLAFMVVSGLLGVVNLRALSIALSVPGEVYAGQANCLHVNVTNRKRFLPSFLVTFHIGEASVFCAMIEGSEEAELRMPVTYNQRGRITLRYIVVSSPFPINFFVRKHTLPAEAQFVVFPTPRMAGADGWGTTKGGKGEYFLRQKGYEGEVAKIADYTGSEPLKLIHWRLSARHEQLKVKELMAAADEPVILDIAALPGLDIEERLSQATFLVNRFMREQRAVGLKLPDRVIPPAYSPAQRLMLLMELAVYGQS